MDDTIPSFTTKRWPEIVSFATNNTSSLHQDFFLDTPWSMCFDVVS